MKPVASMHIYEFITSSLRASIALWVGLGKEELPTLQGG